MSDGPEKLVFVGGAPRSGTTITHALLCTSAQVCRYHPELSFYRGFPIAFRTGRGSWKIHTGEIFGDPDAFRSVIREASDLALKAVWGALDEAPILCVKDPLLTPYFPDLHALYPAEARFVVVIRDPRDVVRSRQEVQAREHPEQPFTLQHAAAIAREYASYYRSILSQNFGGRLFMFRYEDLDSDRVKDGLASFVGVDDLFARPLWGAQQVPVDDPWGSPKYNRGIDLGRRLDPLPDEMAQLVMTIAQPVIGRFGYA